LTNLISDFRKGSKAHTVLYLHITGALFSLFRSIKMSTQPGIQPLDCDEDYIKQSNEVLRLLQTIKALTLLIFLVGALTLIVAFALYSKVKSK
jgi:hypothetical protein